MMVSPSNLLEEILSHFTEEQVMGYYTQCNIPSYSISSPLREDKTPSCSISYYKGRLVFRDWSQGYSYNAIEVASVVLGILRPDEDPKLLDGSRYYLTCKKIYEELVEGKNKPKLDITPFKIQATIESIKDIKVVKRKWTDFDLSYWELSSAELESENIFAIEYALLNNKPVCYSAYKNPTYGYYFPEYNTWKIYSPLTKSIKGAFKPKWLGNVKGHTISITGTNPSMLCTSKKDALMLKKILDVGAISFQSETYIPPKDQLKGIEYIVQDNDIAGEKYSQSLSSSYGLKIIKPIKKDIFEDIKSFDMLYLQQHYLNQL